MFKAHSISRHFFEPPIPYLVSFLQPAPFKLGHRPVKWPVAAVIAPLGAAKAVAFLEHRIDVLCIVGPVGSHVQGSARLETSGAEIEER